MKSRSSYNTSASERGSWHQDSGKGSNTSSSKCLLSNQTIEAAERLDLIAHVERSALAKWMGLACKPAQAREESTCHLFLAHGRIAGRMWQRTPPLLKYQKVDSLAEKHNKDMVCSTSSNPVDMELLPAQVDCDLFLALVSMQFAITAGSDEEVEVLTRSGRQRPSLPPFIASSGTELEYSHCSWRTARALRCLVKATMAIVFAPSRTSRTRPRAISLWQDLDVVGREAELSFSCLSKA